MSWFFIQIPDLLNLRLNRSSCTLIKSYFLASKCTIVLFHWHSRRKPWFGHFNVGSLDSVSLCDPIIESHWDGRWYVLIRLAHLIMTFSSTCTRLLTFSITGYGLSLVRIGLVESTWVTFLAILLDTSLSGCRVFTIRCMLFATFVLLLVYHTRGACNALEDLLILAPSLWA